jgi:hypothetical protein
MVRRQTRTNASALHPNCIVIAEVFPGQSHGDTYTSEILVTAAWGPSHLTPYEAFW